MLLSKIARSRFRVPKFSTRSVTSETRVNGAQSQSSVHALFAAGAFAAAAGTACYYYTSTNAQAAPSKALDANNQKFVDFKVSKVVDVNHNTKIIRFDLDQDQILGLTTASCVVVKLEGVNGKDGKPVIRPYTPLDSDANGFFELLVKKYETGALTPHLHSLKPGDKLSVKGPIAKLPYVANSKKKIGMIAGGTGLTPMLQVAHTILRNPEDKTEVTFIFANIAEEDILLKKEIDDLAAKHKNFKVHYVLEKPPKGWKGDVGYVTKDIIQKHLGGPSSDNLVLVCGPPPMIKVISGSKAPDYTQGELDGYLKELGFTKDQVFKF